VKLLDFGIARAADGSQATKTGMIQGTLDYVAPEVFAGEKATAAADVYAAGLVAWEMLTGRVACAEGSLGAKVGWHMGVGAPDVRTVRSDCPDWLAELLRLFLNKDSSARPKDAHRALVQLRTAKSAASAKTKEAPRAQRPAPPETVRLDVAKLQQEEVQSKRAPAPAQSLPPAVVPPAPVAASTVDLRVDLLKILIGVMLGLAVVGGGWLLASDSGETSTSPATKVAKKASAVSTNTIGMKFVTISPGSFEMGCTPEQSDCNDDEKPAHTVTLSRGFQIQTTEVTQGQYQAVMGTNPSHFSSCGSDCPVEKVSWFDAIEFANALSKKEGLRPAYSGTGDSIRWDKSANGYRLPTEAEWEYAARAGKATLYSGSNEFYDVAWTWSNSGSKTHKVGTKKANAWGLHDMSGNVWEWCWDRYGKSYYGSTSGADPVGATSGDVRVLRGGSWDNGPTNARVAFRSRSIPADRDDSYGGLRLLRTSP
jgi:sulfatase modifying factor 1